MRQQREADLETTRHPMASAMPTHSKKNSCNFSTMKPLLPVPDEVSNALCLLS
jgi:hypothetical protein